MGGVIGGRRHGGNTSQQAVNVTASMKSGKYSVLEAVLAAGSDKSALTALTGGSAFFTDLDGSVCNFFEIYSDEEISIRFRTEQNVATATASLPAITIRANTTQTIDYLADITEAYVSNAGASNANIKIRAI